MKKVQKLLLSLVAVCFLIFNIEAQASWFDRPDTTGSTKMTEQETVQPEDAEEVVVKKKLKAKRVRCKKCGQKSCSCKTNKCSCNKGKCTKCARRYIRKRERAASRARGKAIIANAPEYNGIQLSATPNKGKFRGLIGIGYENFDTSISSNASDVSLYLPLFEITDTPVVLEFGYKMAIGRTLSFDVSILGSYGNASVTDYGSSVIQNVGRTLVMPQVRLFKKLNELSAVDLSIGLKGVLRRGCINSDCLDDSNKTVTKHSMIGVYLPVGLRTYIYNNGPTTIDFGTDVGLGYAWHKTGTNDGKSDGVSIATSLWMEISRALDGRQSMVVKPFVEYVKADSKVEGLPGTLGNQGALFGIAIGLEF